MTFANDLRREGADVLTAAYQAGRTRLRPVVMTAMAMLAGMIPMALGLGEGGEQNAPLGRAVIGGLMRGDRGDFVRGSGGVQPAAQSSAQDFR